MKNKKAYIVFELDIEGKKIPAQVYADELRNIINNNLEKGSQNIEIPFQVGEDVFKVPFKVAELRKMIKRAELYVDMIPITLSKYMKDITQTLSKKKKSAIIGRDHEIEKTWFYISQKTRNNVFLVGEKDVGKTAIATEIIRQIATNECPKEFYDKRVIMLKPQAILKIERDGSYKRTIIRIIKFLYKNKNNIVLYIDKSIYMKTDELLIALLNICITKFNIPIITTSSIENFEKYFLDDPTLSKYVNYITVEEPELEEIQLMIKNHILRLKKQYGIKISDEMIKFGIFTSVLSESESANPGNIVNIFEKAFLEAKRKEKEEVDKESILKCYNSYMKLYNSTTEENKRIIAYHETGHYIVSTLCEHLVDEKIAVVSILPMMDFLGVNYPYIIPGKISFYTKDYFIDEIAVFMGGRIAEKLITSKDSTGASADLAMANSIAERMLTIFGFSEKEDNKNRSYVTRGFHFKDYLISNKRKEEFDDEIQKLVNQGYERAEKIINENRGLIDAIVEKLLQEEILTGEQLTKICEEYKKNK